MMSHTSYNPKFKTKIVAGRLVTVPVYETADNVSFFGDRDERKEPENRFSKTVPNHYGNNRHAVSNDHSLKQLSNARLEAQRNKARALDQTYRSVLSPQPEFRRELPQTRSFASNPLVSGVVSSIASLSRHRLLSAFSQMRRLDPRENGVLTMYEVQDTMAIHNIYLDTQTRERLFDNFTVSEGIVDYQKMWKFFMDCYACKDQIDIPTKEHGKTYSAAVVNKNISMQEQFGVPPGLNAELEYELRKYARQHQQCLETKLLEELFQSLDRYGSGKILKSQVHALCQQYLHGVDRNVLSAVLNICDVEQSGLVNYHKFLKMLSDSQPTYLPPLNNTPLSLISSDKPTHDFTDHRPSLFTNRNGYVDDRKKLLDYLQTLSTPPSKEYGEGYLRNESNIPSGNAKQLEQIGNVGLHLSDFETQVHNRKSTSPSSDTLDEEEEPVRRPGTYDLSPPKQNKDVHHILKDPINPKSRAEEGNPIAMIKKIQNTPKMKASNRKKWADKNKQTQATKVDKWWKKEEHGASGSEDNHSKLIDNRKTWGQSDRIRTVKGKRKKKTFKKLLNKQGISSNSINKDYTTSSATDSEFYTTTDVEVNDERSNCRFILTTDGEREEKLAYTKSESTAKMVENSDSIKPDSQSDERHGSHTTTNYEKLEEDTLNVTENDTKKVTSESIKPELISDKEKEEQSDSLDITSTECENHGDIQEVLPQTNESLSEAIAEKLKIESCSPKPEETTLTVNGHTYPLYPSNATDEDERCHGKSRRTQKLQLEWVYGHESLIHLVTSDQLIFNVGRVMVVMNASKLHQRFFRKHAHDVSAFCVDAKEMLCASAQQSDERKCVVYIWSVVDMSTISTIYVDHVKQMRISAMAFLNIDKQQSYLLILLSSSSMKDQQIRVYGIKDNQVKTSTMISNVTGLVCGTTDGVFATFGKNGHLFLHRYQDGSISSKSASHGDMPVAKTITCAVFNKNSDVITGDSNGTIYLWLCASLRIDHAIHNAHASSITAMCITKKSYLLSGSQKQCSIKAWDPQLQKLKDDYEIPNNCIGVKSLSVFEDSVIVGTISNTTCRINLSSTTNPLCNARDSFAVLVEGHSDVVTCIVHDPTYTEMLISVAADGWLHMYNTNTNSTVYSVRVQGNCSCVVYHPVKGYLFVGCQDGSIHLMDSTTGTFVDKFKDVFASISCLQLSREGNFLCCGTIDGDMVIYIFDNETQELELVESVKIFDDRAVVISMDWDVASNILRIQSSSHAVKYYNVKESSQIEVNPRMQWVTNACSMAYETKGLWSMIDDGTTTPKSSPVFCVSRVKTILAYATAEKLYLMQYPCTRSEDAVHAHASYTTSGCYTTKSPDRVRFSCDGSKLYVIYDKTGCLWQWKIVDDT